MTKIRSSIIVMIVAGALVVTGCSSGAGGSSNGGLTGEPIKLGLVADITGPTIQWPEVAAGAKAAANGINAAGGVRDASGGPNRPIEIDVCDSAGAPAQSSACGRRLVADGVVAVVGSVSLNGDGYGQIVTSSGIPIIGQQAASTIDLNNELSFPMSGTTVALYLQSIGFLASQGVKKISLEHVLAAATDAAVAAVVVRAKELDIEIVSNVAVPADAVDLLPYAAQVTGGGAEGAIFIDSPARNGKFITALQGSGADLTKFTAIGPLSDREIKAAGSAADGWLTPQFAYPLTSTDNKGIAAFLADYETVSDAPESTQLALQAWTAVEVLAADVFPQMKTIDSKTLVATLPTVGTITTPQYVPFQWKIPVVLLPDVPVRAFSDSILVCRVENGLLVPTTDGFKSYL